MRGTLILIVFFSIFLLASLLIPHPMFPGNLFCMLIGGIVRRYIGFFSAFFNGLFYGIILWMVFTILSKRIE